jgi:5-methylcytosine-specific restriction protein A
MSNRDKAEELARKYRVLVRHARYREDGKWYHPLERFPAAFFDANGYILFHTKEEYEKCDYLQFGEDVHIGGDGISSIPGYKRFRQE